MATIAEPEGDLAWSEVYPKLSRLMRSRSWVNGLYITREYALLVPIVAGSVWMYAAWRADQFPTALFLPLTVLSVIAIGAVQHRLSGLGHEASHYSLFHNKLVNDLVSDLFLMFPTFSITQQFRATHLDHHRFVNDPERDPDVRRLGNGVEGAFPLPKGRFLARYVFGSLWPPRLVRYVLGQGHNAGVFARGSKVLRNAYPLWLAVTMLVVFWAVILGTIYVVTGGRAFLLFWCVPLLTSYSFFMQLREIAHHSNAPNAGDLTNSRVFRIHPLLNACVFPYGQDFHLTHHLFGILPHYHAAEAHAVLMRYPPYRENVVICRGYFSRTPGTTGPSVLDVLSGPRHESVPVRLHPRAGPAA
ncbi:MAG TPA: fatty acid desaturase [Fimbriiglobus sp.]